MKVSDLLLLLLCAVAAGPLHAQTPVSPLKPVSTSYAIQGATIFPAPGRTITDGTIVIREGLITAVGKGVTVPPDAIVIAGDSLFVYAGFIDGLSHTGVAKPKETPGRERPKDPGNPPPDAAGITPEQDVRSLLTAAEPSVETLRGLGFTTAHIVPYGGMLPGYGAVVQLHGSTADQMVVSGRASLFSRLAGASRMYPSTVIGVMAKWRELYRQALQSKKYEVLYEAGPGGLTRPRHDRTLEAFYPVIDRRMPVMFEATTHLDVTRVMSLQSDLGFRLMIGDLKQGWDLTTILKKAGTSVFLSLDLPDSAGAKDVVSDTATLASMFPELSALEKKKKDALALYNGQAGAFYRAGIPFGFSTLSAKTSDVRANLRRMIAAGLPEEAALAALTTDPARLLGLSASMGTLEPGKIANVTVCDKPYFDAKARVQHVLVEGFLYSFPPGKEAVPAADSLQQVVGTWTVTIQLPQGTREDKVTIVQEGSTLSGSVAEGAAQESLALDRVAYTGTNLTYSYTVKEGGQSYKTDVRASVKGDVFTGTLMRGGAGAVTVNGKKDPKK